MPDQAGHVLTRTRSPRAQPLSRPKLSPPPASRPDEGVLPGAFSVGVVVCVIVGKVMDRGTVGYSVGLVVVAATGAVFVIAPDQFS